MFNIRISFIIIIRRSCHDGVLFVGEDAIGEIHSNRVTVIRDTIDKFCEFGSED